MPGSCPWVGMLLKLLGISWPVRHLMPVVFLHGSALRLPLSWGLRACRGLGLWRCAFYSCHQPSPLLLWVPQKRAMYLLFWSPWRAERCCVMSKKYYKDKVCSGAMGARRLGKPHFWLTTLTLQFVPPGASLFSAMGNRRRFALVTEKHWTGKLEGYAFIGTSGATGLDLQSVLLQNLDSWHGRRNLFSSQTAGENLATASRWRNWAWLKQGKRARN